jgi:hypothetical protein
MTTPFFAVTCHVTELWWQALRKRSSQCGNFSTPEYTGAGASGRDRVRVSILTPGFVNHIENGV